MMLRVRPAQLTMIAASCSRPLCDVCDAQGKLGSGNAAPSGNGEALVLLRRARVEDYRGAAFLQPRVELIRADVGDVVMDFDSLAEVLAGDVHAPLRRQLRVHPRVDAALNDRHVAVAHALHGVRGQRGAAAVVVAHDNEDAREWGGVVELELQPPPREPAGPGNVWLLYSPASRTSNSAKGVSPSSRAFNSSGVTLPAISSCPTSGLQTALSCPSPGHSGGGSTHAGPRRRCESPAWGGLSGCPSGGSHQRPGPAG